MREEIERLSVVAEAHEWIGTPYHSHAEIKGIGCDCLTLLSGVFKNVGLVLNPEIPHYSPDFMQHRSEEKYMIGLLKYAKEVDRPRPGDIALWKFGRCFSHAAIVVEWPIIIHAQMQARHVMKDDVSQADWLRMLGSAPRPVKFFSFWGQ